MSELSHKDEWKKYGENFCIVVSRHSVPTTTYDDKGPNRWRIYAYIYPKHWHFGSFDGDGLWQDATSVLNLHGGASFFRANRDDIGDITSIQVGCDYNHLHDEYYTNLDGAEGNPVFNDAEALYEWLSAEGIEEIID